MRAASKKDSWAQAQPTRRRHGWLNYAFVALVVVGLVSMLLAGALKLTGAGASLMGRTASDFSLQLFDGRTFSLSQQRGHAVVVNLWASWCPPCRKEMPDLENVWQEYRDRGVVFVGVAVDDNDRDSLAFIQQIGVDYPVGPDRSGTIGNQYAPDGLPVTTVLNREGKITAQKTGAVTASELRSYLDAALR